jgi:hypothetical protein
LRRWWRVLRSNLRCFFFAIRLRRFLITEPIGHLYLVRPIGRQMDNNVKSSATSAATGP